MYLANDVIQNSKKKGPEYGKEFLKVLQKAFTHIGETCHADEKTIGSLSRILKIWDERAVYDSKTVQDYRNALNREKNDNAESGEKNVSAEVVQAAAVPEKRKASEKSSSDKHHHKESKRHKSTTGTHQAHQTHQTHRERVKSETIEVNGTVETHVILNQHAPAGECKGVLYVIVLCNLLSLP